MESILLFRWGGLGDLLVTLPSIFFVRKKFRSRRLTLVCRQEYGSLLKDTGIVDEVVSGEASSLAPLFASSFDASSKLSLWLRKFTLILGWMQKGKSLPLEEFLSYPGAKNFRFFAYNPTNSSQISRFFFERTAEFLSDGCGSECSFEECQFLPLSMEQKEEGKKLLESGPGWSERAVIVHPGSGSEKKCWPLRNFLEIIFRLSQKGVRGALVTGEAEEGIRKEIDKTALPRGWQWIPNPPLLKLAGLLSGSLLYLGNDSGITHLAAGSGAKVLALFRKGLERIWKPYGNSALLSAPSLDEITPAAVWEKVTSLLELS
jgi:heptosyltransferase-3